MLHYSKVLNGLSQYIEAEIAAPFNGTLKAWGIRVAAGVLRERTAKILAALMQHPAAKALEIVDGEMIDDELFFRLLADAARKGTATVDIMLIGPVTFGEHDVDALRRYVMGG
jgi:hypothetical protein